MDELIQTETIVSKKRSFKELFFSSEWRMSGREYALYTSLLSLWYLLACTIVWFIFWIIIWISWKEFDNFEEFGVIAALIIWIPYIIMEIFVSIKRVHDFWKKGSYVWYLLIPLFNLYVWLQLLFQKWDEWRNLYWEKPQEFSSGKKALTIILYIIYTAIYVYSNINQ